MFGGYFPSKCIENSQILLLEPSVCWCSVIQYENMGHVILYLY